MECLIVPAILRGARRISPGAQRLRSGELAISLAAVEKMIAEPMMLSQEYLKTARTLFRVARSTADQAVADRLRALAADYERRAEQAAGADAANIPAFKVGSPERVER
jgi:hypothetical protein